MFLDARRTEYVSVHRMIPLIYSPYLSAEAFRIYVLYVALAGSEGHAEVGKSDVCRFFGIEIHVLEEAHEALRAYGLIQLKEEAVGDSDFICTLLPPPPLPEEHVDDFARRTLPVETGAALPKPVIARRSRNSTGVTPAKLILKFYRAINRPKIDSDEREMAKAEIADLRTRYTLEQIDDAIQWTLDNQDVLFQPVESFAIIQDTIDQALAAKEQSTTHRAHAQADAAVEEEEFRKQREAVREFRKDLTSDQLAEIRELALAEIAKDEGLIPALVTEAFIRATEDKIIVDEYMSDSFESG